MRNEPRPLIVDSIETVVDDFPMPSASRNRLLAVLLGLALGACVPGVALLLSSWASRPIEIVEALDEPDSVVAVTPDGLQLSDGRFVGWGIEGRVPESLSVVSELTASGIEVDSQGRAIGLVEIHHWCGNDPIRRHVARADIGRVLEYLGGRAKPGSDQPLEFREGGILFTRFGWNVSSWYGFERWSGRDPGRIWSD